MNIVWEFLNNSYNDDGDDIDFVLGFELGIYYMVFFLFFIIFRREVRKVLVVRLFLLLF